MFKILLLDTKSHNPNHYIVKGIAAALREHPRIEKVTLTGYDEAMRRAAEERYDILLAVDGEAIVVDLITRLRPMVGYMALWTFEDPYERDRTVPIAELFDAVFTNDLGSTSAYPNVATHLPLAASPELDHRPVVVRDEDFQCDIAFIGSAWPNRVVFLRRLLRTLPSLKYRIVLNYNQYLPRAYLDLPESSYVSSVSHHDFITIANRARINLTLHRDFSGDGRNNRALTPGPRLFELGMAGGFQLIDAHDVPIGDFYQDGVEVDVFDDFDTCVEKIRHRLANAEDRQLMALAAQNRTLRDHTYDNRVSAIIENFSAHRSRKNVSTTPITVGKPKLLFVTHNTIANGHFGGVEVYQETIANVLRDEYEIFFYRPNPISSKQGQREFVLSDDSHKIIRRYFTPDFDVFRTMSEATVEATFARVLTDYSIDLVHFHHLINHPLSLPLIAQTLGIPTVYTAQDFWLVCHRFNLLNEKRRYCDIANRTIEVCDVCLLSSEGCASGAQGYRRTFASRVISSFSKVIANSPSASEILSKIFPELVDTNSFVPLGLPLPAIPRGLQIFDVKKNALPPVIGANPPLKVVFLGNFTHVKGADCFLQAAAQLKTSNIQFAICGRIDDEYRKVLEESHLNNVEVRGGFEPGELDLTEFDVSLLISIWPETYCITLSESWRAGVVPIVTPVGALGDRVKDEVDGFHVPIGGAGELVHLLRRLEGDRSALAAIRKSIKPDLWITPAQHGEVLSGVYRALLAGRKIGVEPLADRPDSSTPVTLALTGVQLNSSNWMEPESLRGGALPAPETRMMNPLWRATRLLSDNLAAGRIDLFPAMTPHTDQILRGGMPVDVFRRPSRILGGSEGVQITGWVRTNKFTGFEGLAILFRSQNGDQILTPVQLVDRQDVRSTFPDSETTGFLSDPLVLQMLDEGLYAVELVRMAAQQAQIVPLDCTLIVRDGVFVASHRSNGPEGSPSRVPFNYTGQHHPGKLTRGATWSVDDLLVETIGTKESFGKSAGLRPEVSRLFVRGWTKGTHNRLLRGDLAVNLLGTDVDKGYYGPLVRAPRIDVAESFSAPELVQSGYEGAVWLSDLAPGRYRIVLTQRDRNSTFVHEIADRSLTIRLDGTAEIEPGHPAEPIIGRELVELGGQ